MTTKDCITLWHLKDNKTGFLRSFFSKAHVHTRDSFTKSGIKEKGFHPSGTASVRIPTNEKIVVSPGDYIQVGEHSGDEPDYGNAFRITAVSDNRRGASPHWKLLCGGDR